VRGLRHHRGRARRRRDRHRPDRLRHRHPACHPHRPPARTRRELTTMTTTATTTTAPATGTDRTDPPALRLDGVRVTYPDGRHADGSPRTATALDDAHITADRGEFTIVLGPSGSGKSTLLSVAAGLVGPDAGRVTVDGTDLTALDERRRTEVRRDRIGLVFQQPN